MKTNTKKLILAGLFLALCLLLPFLTGQIPQIGSALSPMHLPVLICGFVCGWPYGLAVGLLAPILRSLLFLMPSMFPTAVAMSLELCVYGLMTGLLFGHFKDKPHFVLSVYVSLAAAMLVGRVAWGIVMFLLCNLSGTSFTFEMFLAGAFLNAVPGIVAQLVLVPLAVAALRKARLF